MISFSRSTGALPQYKQNRNSNRPGCLKGTDETESLSFFFNFIKLKSTGVLEGYREDGKSELFYLISSNKLLDKCRDSASSKSREEKDSV